MAGEGQSLAPSRGRYAPSPTGRMHLGNARTAMLAWLDARARGDAFVLRIEDLDRARVRPDAEQALLADLLWLGLDFWPSFLEEVDFAFGPVR